MKTSERYDRRTPMPIAGFARIETYARYPRSVRYSGNLLGVRVAHATTRDGRSVLLEPIQIGQLAACLVANLGGAWRCQVSPDYLRLAVEEEEFLLTVEHQISRTMDYGHVSRSARISRTLATEFAEWLDRWLAEGWTE